LSEEVLEMEDIESLQGSKRQTMREKKKRWEQARFSNIAK